METNLHSCFFPAFDKVTQLDWDWEEGREGFLASAIVADEAVTAIQT